MDDPLITLKTLSNNTHYIRDFYFRMILGFTILLDIYIVGIQIMDFFITIDFSLIKKIPFYFSYTIVFITIPTIFYFTKYLAIRNIRHYFRYNIFLYIIFSVVFLMHYAYATTKFLNTLPTGEIRLVFTFQYFFGVLCCGINAMYAFSKKYIYFLPNSMRNK